MIKPIPMVIVIAAGVFSGVFVGPRLARPDDESGSIIEARQKPTSVEVRAEVARLAKEWLDANAASEVASVDEAEEESLFQRLQPYGEEVDELASAGARISHAVELAQKIASQPLNPAEQSIRKVTVTMLAPLPLGRVLLRSTDADVRRRGVELLGRAAQRGDAEALDELGRLLDGVDAALARTALDNLRDAADERGEGRSKLFDDAGVTTRIVALLSTGTDAQKRDAAEILTDLANPVATTYWRDIFNRPSSGEDRGSARRRAEAATKLADLGSPTEMSQIVNEAAVGLTAVEESDVRRAVTTLGALRTPEAKKLIEDALARDPEGPNARLFNRTLRELRAVGGENIGRPRRRGGE